MSSLPRHLEVLHATHKYYRYLATSNHSVSSSDKLLICTYRTYSVCGALLLQAHHVASALLIMSGHSNVQTPESFMLCLRTLKRLGCCQSTNPQPPSLACADLSLQMPFKPPPLGLDTINDKVFFHISSVSSAIWGISLRGPSQRSPDILKYCPSFCVRSVPMQCIRIFLTMTIKPGALLLEM